MENQFKEGPVVPGFNIEDTELFGKFLRRSREEAEKKKSQKQIALELGVHPQMIQNYEAGVSFPKEERLPDIAKAYGVDLQELVRVFKISKDTHERLKTSRKKS